MANRAGIILAAGQGTRMKSARPKVMHEVAGRPMLGHVIAAMRAAGVSRIVVVTAPDAEEVRAYAAREGGGERHPGASNLAPAMPLHAPARCSGIFPDLWSSTYGDMPLVASDTFERSFRGARDAGMAIVAFQSRQPAYGRVILDRDGILDRIVEYKDANADERPIDFATPASWRPTRRILPLGGDAEERKRAKANII